MKKLLLFLLVAFSLSSCLVNRIAYKTNVSMISYDSFTRDGFFITESNSVSFDYDPVGSVSVMVSSGYVESEKDLKKSKKAELFTDNDYIGDEKDLLQNPYYNSGSIFVEATHEDAFLLIRDEVIEKGGNGIINLKFEFGPMMYDHKDRAIGVEYVYLSGMAIKK